ncbi:MAG: hypothetical protein JKY65_24625 [Planctomycetes bacterium]|nr:hypothetical protein [Planctomycetota bacterium]
MIRTRIRRGQGMTEYIVLLGVIAIFLIVAVGTYGDYVEEAIVGTKKAFDDNKIGSGVAPGTVTPPPAVATPTGTTPAGTYVSNTGASEFVFKDNVTNVVQFANRTALTTDQLAKVTGP